MRLTFLKKIITPSLHHVADIVPAQIPDLEMCKDIDLLLALDLVPEALMKGLVDIDHQVALVHPLVHVDILARVLVLCHHHDHSHLGSDADDIGPQLPLALALDLDLDLARDHPAHVGRDTILLPVVSPTLELVRGFRSCL
jgi:hypothetical protein